MVLACFDFEFGTLIQSTSRLLYEPSDFLQGGGGNHVCTDGGHFLLFDVWPVGGVDSMVLCDAIKRAAQASLYEYNVDQYLLAIPRSISEFGPQLLAPTLVRSSKHT